MKKEKSTIKTIIEIPAAFLGSIIGQLGAILIKHTKIEIVIVNVITGALLGWCIAWLLDRMKPTTTPEAKEAKENNWRFRFAIAAIFGFFGMVVVANGPSIIEKLLKGFL